MPYLTHLVQETNGSKAANMYQIKYMTKACVEISASASVLLDALKHNKEYASTAVDTGTIDRTSKYFCQRAIHHSGMEMEGIQAAGIVTSLRSSGSSDVIHYYSAWDMQRLARIVSVGHNTDVNFIHEDLDSSDNDSNNSDDDAGAAIDDEMNNSDTHHDDLNGLDAAAAAYVDAMPSSTTIVDLLGKFHDMRAEGFSGYAAVYTTSQNEKVPVSAAHHYMYRDARLWRFSAYEFERLFTVRVMNRNDSKWYEEATSTELRGSAQPAAGRTCNRYLFQAPHPLHTSHILVPKAKQGTPAFAGNPPPSDTTSLLMDSTANQKRIRYAEFFVSNFIPWSASRPPVLSYETWKLHVTALEREACLHCNREPDAPDNASHNEMLAIQSAERSRFIAAGRLYDIENITSGFKTTKDSQILLGKHRSRDRTLWTETNKPFSGTASSELQAAALEIEKLRDRQSRLLGKPDQAKRLTDSSWFTEWTKKLSIALRYTGPGSTNSPEELGSIWRKAAFPTKRSLNGGIPNVKELVSLLKKRIVLNDSDDWDGTSITAGDGVIGGDTIGIDPLDPFIEISDSVYESLVEAHKSSGLPDKDAPLNPEQRAGARDMLKVALLRKQRKLEGETLQQVMEEIKSKGLHQITMLTGEGLTLPIPLLAS